MIVLTWFHFKVLIIPLIVAFLFGLTGIMPDNDYKPVRAFIAAASGICLVIWVFVMIGRALLL